jgi:hypothetical protein
MLCLVAVAAVVAAPSLVLGQEAVSPEQNKLLAKRAAEADAYRKLAETVYGLQINSETYVRDFITESDVIRTDLDTYIRGVRLGEPKWDADLVCTVEAEVTVAKVIQELQSLHSRHYKGDKLKATDFEQMKQYIKKDVIKAVGRGAPRPDLPPDVPGGDIPAPAGVKLPEPVIPPIWKAVPANERLMAERAAEIDAKRQLVERIKGLRINSETVVRDFVAESDVIFTEANAMLTGAHQVGKAYYHFDELIVEVTVEVPLESVITIVKSLHTRHYKGDKVKGTDIEHITQNIKSQTFKATGMGVPRPQVIQKAMAAVQVNVPDWVGETVRAEGKGVPPTEMANTPQGKLMAARAAELDAKRKLGERVMGLAIDSSTTVQNFVTQHDEINTQLNAYITGSYVKSTTYDDQGTATVTVEMPAMQVWEIVHTYIRVVRK